MPEKIHLLFVDNEPELLKTGKLFLEKTEGFTVDTITSAKEALALIPDQQYDAIISDYQMPGMDGIAFLRTLRSSSVNIPFILFTKRSREEVVIQALNEGADFYLQKGGDPVVQFAELVHAIRLSVSRRRIERDLLRNNEELSAVNEELIASEEELRVQYHELARQEQEIRESEERFRGVFNSSLVGIAITDREGRWLYFNEALCTMLGYSADELRTKTWSNLTHPEDLEHEIVIFQSVLAGGEPLNIEKQYIRKDLSRIDVIVSTGIVRDPDGAIAYFSSVILDITGRKRAEEELRTAYGELAVTEKQHRKTIDLLENLIAIAHVPIIVWDSEYRIIRINHIIEQITGRPASACIGSPIQSLFSPDQAVLLNRLLDTTEFGVKWENVELLIPHQDGTYRTILWNTSTLYDSPGITPIATLAQGKDVTEERRYATERGAALVEIQKNLAQLAILNDEIRNPLTIIITCANLLGPNELINQIMIQAERIDGMVTNLDQRWAESEKVLRAIRRHYQIEVNKSRESEQEEGSGRQANEADIRRSGEEDSGLSLIQEIQAQLYTILDSMDALIYVSDMQTYDLLYMNQRGRAFLGNVAGKKCYQVMFPGQDTPCSFCTNGHLMKNSRPAGVYRWEFEDTRNGRWFDCRDQAVRWSDGRWVRLEIATDITKKKRIERSLLERESAYRLLADNIGDVIWTADLHMQLTYVSPSILNLTGYTPEEFLALRPDEALTPDSVSRLIKSRQVCMENILSGGLKRCQPAILELEYQTKDGLIVPTETTISLIFCEEDGLQGVVGVTRDITARKLAEAAIREQEIRYREIFDSFDDLYYETDENGIITVLSPSVYRLSGWSIEDLVGKPVTDLYINPQDRGVLLSELQRQGFVRDYELLLLKKDGTPIQISLSGSVMKKPDGTPGGVRGSLRDITKRKAAEEALRESEEKYRAISEYSHNAICIVNEYGQIIWINEEMVRTGGYSRDQIASSRSFAEFIAPESLEFVLQNFNKFVLKEPYTHHYTFNFIRADGKKRLCSKYMTDYTDSHGKRNLIISMLDITEKEQFEVSLMESEEKYRLLVENQQDLVVKTDNEGKILYANPAYCRLFDITEDEIRGTHYMPLVHPEDRKAVEAAVARPFEPPYQTSYEERAGTRYGWRWIAWTAKALRNDEGEIIELVGTGRDITVQKAAEEALHIANKKLKLLSGIARHDINNQIMVLQGYLDLTIDRIHDPTLSQYLGEAEMAATAIQRQIDFTKMYEELGVQTPTWQQVSDIIATIDDSFIPIRHDCNDILIYADPMFERVLYNLYDNTVRYACGSDTIRIGCAKQDDLLIIWEDNGTGVPLDQKEQIFEKGVGKNTGFGLFLAREILSITGISIRETGEPGKGARFLITVPDGKWQNKRERD